MSNFRQTADGTILARTFGVTFLRADPHRLTPPTAPGWDQLIYATRGTMTVAAPGCSWVVPPHRAVWIPSGLVCQVEMSGEVALRILYLRTGLPLPAAVVNVTPLMRELIVRAVRLSALDGKVPAQRRLVGVMRDELRTLRRIPLQLPLPEDPRALRFAEMADSAPPAELARRCGAGLRTLERIFREETSMSLGQWLRRHKLMRAVRLLAAGRGVKETAHELGYAHPSAFIAMFRRELGQTPSQYLAE